jgi:hypothetical protein
VFSGQITFFAWQKKTCFMLDFPISHGKTCFFLFFWLYKCILWLYPIFVSRIPQVSQEVLVLDLLATFDCLDAVSQQRFLRRRVQPVLKRLGPTGRFRLGRDLWRSKKSLEIGWDTTRNDDEMGFYGDSWGLKWISPTKKVVFNPCWMVYGLVGKNHRRISILGIQSERWPATNLEGHVFGVGGIPTILMGYVSNQRCDHEVVPPILSLVGLRLGLPWLMTRFALVYGWYKMLWDAMSIVGVFFCQLIAVAAHCSRYIISVICPIIGII